MTLAVEGALDKGPTLGECSKTMDNVKSRTGNTDWTKFIASSLTQECKPWV